MKNIKHVSKQDDVGFLHDLVKTICNSTENVDLSILLKSEEAEYVNELFEYNGAIIKVPNDFDNDYGELTGLCLVTIVKEDNFVQVIVEDYAYLNPWNIPSVKYHEADLLMLLEGHGKNSNIIDLYEPRKTIFVSFADEESELNSLLFS